MSIPAFTAGASYYRSVQRYVGVSTARGSDTGRVIAPAMMATGGWRYACAAACGMACEPAIAGGFKNWMGCLDFCFDYCTTV